MRKSHLVATALLITTLSIHSGSIVAAEQNEQSSGIAVEREGQPDVHYVKKDDPKMVAAINQARSNIEQFITTLNNPKPSQSGFAIKLAVKDDGNIEHMWLSPVRYRDRVFFGTINNEPVSITTVKIGDQVSVAADQISDWMYIENGKLSGGYTIRAVRDRLSANEQAAFDSSLPFTID